MKDIKEIYAMAEELAPVNFLSQLKMIVGEDARTGTPFKESYSYPMSKVGIPVILPESAYKVNKSADEGFDGDERTGKEKKSPSRILPYERNNNYYVTFDGNGNPLKIIYEGYHPLRGSNVNLVYNISRKEREDFLKDTIVFP